MKNLKITENRLKVIENIITGCQEAGQPIKTFFRSSTNS
jgi:hypothetical protein